MPRAVALLLMTILAGCRGSDEPRPAQPDDAGPSCAAGFDLAGEVCVLHFDACDDRSIPRPGGGCEKVGVETCAKGFREDGHGGCEAIQPASPCGKGTMAIPGETACREVMDCGTDPYGGAPDSALHVDKSASPDGADGTLAHPYASIAVAVASSSPGAIIAIAAGTYPESFDLDRPLTLQGRCPSMVEISGDGASGASIGIVPGIADITIRGLSITGRDVGIDAQGGFTADSVRIHDIGMGVSVDTPGESPVVIRNALIENTVRPGVRAIGGAVAIERSVIRDATSTAPANLGMAVSAVYAASGLGSASIVDSVIERGVQANVFGCTALTVERSLLRGGTAGSTTPSGS
ncbi:MAG: DUF1565 domain-containing protein, partial [Polyangiales bacterium]